MKKINILFIFLILCVQYLTIICDDANSTSTTDANSTSTNRTKRPTFEKGRPFNMTYDEMDTLMVCTILVQQSLQKQVKEVQEVAKRINTTTNMVYEKVGTDIFEQCTKKMNIADVHVFMKNLTYFNNFKWEDKFDELVKLDYTKYNNLTDLHLTVNQQILMYKFQKVDELFRQKKADNREMIENENRKLKIGNLELEKIPGMVKGGIFLVIFGLFFGGLYYLLKSLDKKKLGKKDKKDKKKKKTQ